jgi:protein-export membrane protein SecD
MKKYSFKLIATLVIISFSIFFSLPSIVGGEKLFPSWWEKHKIKLGLDLQGGSQLLLQVETDSAVKEKLQNYMEDIRNSLKKESISSNKISFDKSTIYINFDKKYYEQIKKNIKSYDFFQSVTRGNVIELTLTEKYIQGFKSSLMLQSLEIIRKRVDEVGTNEPVIQIQGKQRVLVQLPGLKDPDRIKSLLGQTAKMNFRLVDEKAMGQLNEKKYFIGAEVLSDDEFGTKYVIKKRIGVDGDNLVDASASVDQFNRPVVSIRFDSMGSRKFADLTSKNVGKRFAIVLDKSYFCSGD